ncbi:MAG: ABC transporter ATP-binding protein [Bacteroidia bacterium]
MARPRFNSNHQTDTPLKMKRIKAEQWQSIRWVFPYAKPYRWRLLVSSLLLIIGTSFSLAFPWLMGRMLDSALHPEKAFWSLQQLALALGGLLAFQAILSFVRIRTMIEVAEKILADARSAVFDHLLKLPMAFYMRHRVGELQSRLSSDLSQIQDAVSSTLTEWLRQVLVLVGGLALLLYTSWNLTLFLLAILPALVLVAVVFGRKIRQLAGRAQDELAQSQVVVEETLQSVAMVKAYTGEQVQGYKYREGLASTVREVMKAAWYRGAFAAFIVFGLFGTVVLVLWYGAGLVQEGSMSIGELTGFVLYATFVGGAMGSFAELYGQLQKSLGATERVAALLQETTEETLWAQQAKDLPSTMRPDPSDSALVLEEITFAYPSRPEVKVLDRVSLHLNQGERLAVVGPSGAGKSTLIQLLLGFYAPDRGVIRVNGYDLRSMNLRAYRESLAVVPQDLSLFGGTLAENIAYGCPEATDEQIREAAEQAYAMEFIAQFPEGMQTIVGERGVQISGGQRQRVAIARAILRNPRFLFLDEATSALDTDSEIAVQQGLDRLMEGRTTVVVAHRLSTVRHADRVAFMDGGRVVEYGSPAELMRQKESRFRRWMESQGETV